MKSRDKKDWEKNFDWTMLNGEEHSFDETYHYLDKFIQQLLTSDRQRVVEIIKKMKIGEAEGWDYFFSKRGRCCPGDDFSDVYNKALEDIIKSLNKL
jgi:hypothetical protein